MTIREAIIADIPRIIEVANAAWNETYILPSGLRTRFLVHFYSPDALSRAIRKQGTLFHVVFDQGLLIAFSQWVPVEPSIWELVRIYVHPAHQRRGAGRLLLLHGLGSLPDDTRIIRLDVHKENRRACRFYEKAGFHRCGESVLNIWGNSIPVLRYEYQLR